MADDDLFRPYKIIQQSGSSLRLKAGVNPGIIRAAFLAGPVVFFIAGIALYATQKDPRFLYILCGVAALELFLFSFIKISADLRMDSVGFTLQRISVKRVEEVDCLWNDVDRIRWRLLRTKGGQVLAFEAMMKEGGKLRLLNFSNFNPKKQSAAEIASVLARISRKAVVEK